MDPRYHQTGEHSPEDGDDEKQSFLGHLKERQQSSWTRPSRTSIALSALNLLALLVSSILFVTSWHHRKHVLNAELRQASTYSTLLVTKILTNLKSETNTTPGPVHDHVDLELHPIKVNGSLFTPPEPSIARAMPNNASDEIWDEIELTRVLPVTRDDIVRMGKDPSTAVKLEDELWGLGDDAYATILDVYHQLHCLNSLRQIAYGKYYERARGSAEGEPSIRDIHINHCADILYQALVCSGNVNLISMHWVETQSYPFPDM